MTIIKTDVDVRFSGVTLSGDIEHLPEKQLLMLHTEEGLEVLSINTGAEAPMSPSEDRVHIKDYSEHSGMAQSLEEAGIVRLLGKYGVGPFHSPVYIAEVI